MGAEVLTQPAFSVIIPTWNRAGLIERAVASVLSQTFADLELIVVDDGSDDGTRAILQSITDPRLRVLFRPHRGVSAARNTGLEKARGPFVAFLDSDDAAMPEWLDTVSIAFRETGADLVVSGAVTRAADGRESVYLPAPSEVSPDAVATRFLPGCYAVRRRLLAEAGGFDPDVSFGENTELALRLFDLRPPPKVTALSQALVIRRAPAQPDRGAEVASARKVLDRHRRSWKRFPRLWASYSAIAGVDCARRGQMWQARKRFLAAVRADPRSVEHLGRLVASLVPGLSTRVWSPVSYGRRDAVLFVVLAPGVGGSVRSLNTVLAHVSGVHRLVARPPGTSTARFLQQSSASDVDIDLPPLVGGRLAGRMKASLVLTRAALRHRHDLAAIHANGLAELSVAWLAAVVARCRLVVWVHEWQISNRAIRTAPVLRAAGRRIRYAVVSEQSRQMVLAGGLARPQQVTVIPNPVDPADVRFNGDHPATGSVTAGFIGTPAIYKGFDLLPGIVRATRGDGIGWVIYAGPESMMPDVFNELRGLGADIRGKTLDIREAYRRCELVVVPSRRESFGRVAVEAMSNGRPVVVSDVAPLRELVGDEEAGLVAEPGDASSFAAAVRRLAGDDQLRLKLGEEGRRRADAFAPGPIVRQLSALYGIECPRRRPPRFGGLRRG